MRNTRSLFFLETTGMFGILRLASCMQGVAVFAQHLRRPSGIVREVKETETVSSDSLPGLLSLGAATNKVSALTISSKYHQLPLLKPFFISQLLHTFSATTTLSSPYIIVSPQ